MAAELIKAHGRASHLKCLLTELKLQLDLLTKDTVNKLCAEEEKKLKEENEKLKTEVTLLRNKLIQLESKHNKKQVPLPYMGVNKTLLPLVEKPKAQEPQIESSQFNGLATKVEIKEKNEKKIENKSKKNPSAKPESKPATTVAVATADDVVDASRLNMRIGRIVDVAKHPDADSLYVESVDVGELKLRTIVSGLVNHVPIGQMKDRVAVFLLNLKPAKMRGVLSEGMIMCASTPEKVEILSVPEGVIIGERVTVDGYEGEPDEQLNTKKKKVPTATLR